MHRNKRCSRPLYNSQRPHEPPPDTTSDGAGERSPQRTQQNSRKREPGRPLRTQQRAADPGPRNNVTTRPDCLVFPLFLEQPPPIPENTAGRTCKLRGGTEALHPHHHACTEQSPVDTPAGKCSVKLLRKEVIQPHLPVRLPCYDFVPIASPTFDRSPQQAGWATGFGCYRLS